MSPFVFVMFVNYITYKMLEKYSFGTYFFVIFFCFSVLLHINHITTRKAGEKYVKPKTSLLVELLWVKKLQKIFALKKFRHIKSIQKQVNASEREKEGDV